MIWYQTNLPNLYILSMPNSVIFYFLPFLCVGKGKFGVVKKGISLKNPDFKVAVKMIELDKLASL